MIDLDASFHPEEEDQTPAAVFRYSAIGPSDRGDTETAVTMYANF
jgi:hypothetical protein